MATQRVTVLAPRTTTEPVVHDAVHHVGARFGVDVTELASHVTDSGLRATTTRISGTATGVENALRGLAEHELRWFARLA